MPLNLQARLLRVLQERCVTPLGSTRTVQVDISLVCATHRKLREGSRPRLPREDLYYRLNGMSVTLPPCASAPTSPCPGRQAGRRKRLRAAPRCSSRQAPCSPSKAMAGRATSVSCSTSSASPLPCSTTMKR